MLKDLLSEDLVALGAEAGDWREAVRTAGALFERTGRADPSYTEAMIASVEKFGPYIVLEEGIAMPHAQSDGNVSEPGICVVTLKDPVAFEHDEFDPVRVLIGICAPDPTAHLSCLSELSEIFEDEDIVSKLHGCGTAQEVLDTIGAAL